MFQGILVTDITDHYPIFHMCRLFNSTSSIAEDEFFYTRRMNQSNLKTFKMLISKNDWNDVMSKSTCGDAFDIFYAHIKSCYHQAFPLIKVKRKSTKHAPWVTEGLRTATKVKNKLYKRSLRHPTALNKTEYAKYRNKLTQLLRKQHRNYYEFLIQESKNNLTKTWNIIKSVINNKRTMSKCSKFVNNNITMSDDLEIANHFDNYFANIGPNLAKVIPDTTITHNEFLKDSCNNSIFLQPVTDEEIYNIIKSLKNGSPGIDNICAKPIKYVKDLIIHPLRYVCQLSLSQGCFPHELKVSKIIPLYKSGDRTLFNNYRPISLLPLFSKVLERLMYDRLYDFLVKYSILYSFQFGFRKAHSTYMALTCMLDKLHNALEKGEYAIGIFIDYRKAFDTVDHSILLQKLYHYGIRGEAYDWFYDYLKNRTQLVSYHNIQSNYADISCGVPQRSILGPLLFLIYINDMAFVSTQLFSVLFADDTNMFSTDNDLEALIINVNTELEKIVKWLNANKLSLNIDKTHYMLFRNKGKVVKETCKVYMNRQEISEVETTKFLGVIIDNRLN